MLEVGGLLQVLVCGLWFVVCGRVPKFGYRFFLSGESVPAYTIKKFQVFQILNPFGLVPAKVVRV